MLTLIQLTVTDERYDVNSQRVYLNTVAKTAFDWERNVCSITATKQTLLRAQPILLTRLMADLYHLGTVHLIPLSWARKGPSIPLRNWKSIPRLFHWTSQILRFTL